MAAAALASPQLPSTSPSTTQAVESSTKSPSSAPSKAPSSAIGTSFQAQRAAGGKAAATAERAHVTDVTLVAEPDVLEIRLAATEKWLATEANNLYSIQLMGTGEPEQLKHHLNELSKFVEINKIFVYRTVANGRPFVTVLYGTFSDRRSAQDVLDKLPEGLKTNRPILRTVDGIRGELRRNQSS